jgi:hypothetical protein
MPVIMMDCITGVGMAIGVSVRMGVFDVFGTIEVNAVVIPIVIEAGIGKILEAWSAIRVRLVVPFRVVIRI